MQQSSVAKSHPSLESMESASAAGRTAADGLMSVAASSCGESGVSNVLGSSVIVYLSYGGSIVRNGRRSCYEGGDTVCVVLQRGMSYEDVKLKIYQKVAGDGGEDKMLWFAMPCDMEMIIPLDGNDAVSALMTYPTSYVYVTACGKGYGKDAVKGGELGGMDVDGTELRETEHFEGSSMMELVRNMSMYSEERDVGNELQETDVHLAQNVSHTLGNTSAMIEVDDSSRGAVCEGVVEPDVIAATDHCVGGLLGLPNAEAADDPTGFIEGGQDPELFSENDRYGGEMLQSAGNFATAFDVDTMGRADGPTYERRLAVWKDVIVGEGQTFKNVGELRESIFKYSIANMFSYRYVRNGKQRVHVTCSANACPFEIYASSPHNMDGRIVVRKFNSTHSHTAAENCMMARASGWHRRSKLIAQLVAMKNKLAPDCTPHEIRREVETELGLKITYNQAWRAREVLRDLVMGKPKDQYKLVPWLCNAIKRANPGSVADCELRGTDFGRLFIALDACVRGFMNGCRRILFVDGCHLSDPYKGTMLAACAVDADNHFLNVAFAVVTSETKEEWMWFLSRLRDLISGVETVIMSDRHPGLIGGVEAVFDARYHSYCLRHICENFAKETYKHGTKSKAHKDLVLEMLMRVAYAPNPQDSHEALEELRSYNAELAIWVETNQPERWAVSKFPYMKWGWMNNNVAESFNKWMLSVRGQPVGWFLITTVDNIARKMQQHKDDALRWPENGFGPGIDRAIRRRIAHMPSIANCLRYSSHQFQVVLTNGRRLVVDLEKKTCTCREWELTELPCPHAIYVICEHNLELCEYVGDCYKRQTQLAVYNVSITPIETHDMPCISQDGSIDVAADEDDGVPCNILPPRHGRLPGRPQKRRIESQFQDKRRLRCTNCREVGHNRRTCTSERVDDDCN